MPRITALAVLLVPALVLAGAPAAQAAAKTPAPSVSSVSPRSGRTAHGTRVTVSGSGFTQVTAVRFGTATGTGVRVSSSRRLTVLTPTHGAGRVDVTVATKHGTSKHRAADRFRYYRDTTAPGPVTSVHAADATPSSVTVAWNRPAASDLGGFLVRRAAGAVPPTATTGTALARVSATARSYTDSGLAPVSTYSYAVFAVDTSGNVALAATLTASTTPTTAGPLSGTVTAGGTPTAGVTVRVIPVQVFRGRIQSILGRTYATTETLDDGTWSVPAGLVPYRAYAVCFDPSTATDPDYVAECYRETGPHAVSNVAQGLYSFGEPIVLAPGESRSDIDEALVPGGTITGTVTDTAGAPLGGVRVSTATYDDPSTEVPGSDSVLTAADGSYSLTGVGAVDHNLCFFTQTASGGSSAAGYANRCYGSKYDPTGEAIDNEPGFVRVASGTTVDLGAEKLPAAGAITGKVTDSHGVALPGVAVSAPGLSSSTTVAGADGSYTLRGLDPVEGGYTLCFDGRAVTAGTTSTGYLQRSVGTNRDCDIDTDDPGGIPVTPGSTSTASVRLTTAAAVTGRVTDAAGDPLAGVAVATEYSNDPTAIRTAADGTYRITGVDPGQNPVCFFTAEATGGSSLTGYASRCAGSSTLPKTPPTFAFTAGVSRVVDASLAPGAAIAGHVLDSAGAAVRNVSVLAPSDADENIELLQIVGGYAVLTAADGSFEITGLPAAKESLCFSVDNTTVGPSTAGYLDRCHGNTAWDGTSAPPAASPRLTMTAGHVVDSGDATLPAGGGFTGRVVDSTGAALTDVLVELDATTGNANGYATTDTDGTFAVSGLSAGTYRACYYATQGRSYGTGRSGDLTACPKATIVIKRGAVTTGGTVTVVP